MSYNSRVIWIVISNRLRSANLKLRARLLPEFYSSQSYYHYLWLWLRFNNDDDKLLLFEKWKYRIYFKFYIKLAFTSWLVTFIKTAKLVKWLQKHITVDWLLSATWQPSVDHTPWSSLFTVVIIISFCINSRYF